MAEATQYSTEHLHTDRPELVIQFDTTDILHPGAHVERPDGVKGTIYAAIQPDRTADHSHGMSTIYVVRYEDGAVGTAGVERITDENGKNKFQTRAGALLTPGEKYYYGRIGDAHTQPVSEETILGAEALMGVTGRQFSRMVSRIHGSMIVSPDGGSVTLHDGSLGQGSRDEGRPSANGSLVHIGPQISPQQRASQRLQDVVSSKPPAPDTAELTPAEAAAALATLNHSSEASTSPRADMSVMPEASSHSSPEIVQLKNLAEQCNGVLHESVRVLAERANTQLNVAYQLKEQLDIYVRNPEQREYIAGRINELAQGLVDVCRAHSPDAAIRDMSQVINAMIEQCERTLSNPQPGEKETHAAVYGSASDVKGALHNFTESYDRTNTHANFSALSFDELYSYVSSGDEQGIARVAESLEVMMAYLQSDQGIVHDAAALQQRVSHLSDLLAALN